MSTLVKLKQQAATLSTIPTATINTANLNTGMYLVYLQVDGVGVASEQLIVIH